MWSQTDLLENKCKICIKFCSRYRNWSVLSKCLSFPSVAFYCQIMDCWLIEQNLQWHWCITVRHFESTIGSGFMVSRISIRFFKIWLKQTQRILKPVLVLSNQTRPYNQWHRNAYNADVVGTSPVGAAPATSSFFAEHLASIYFAKTTAGRHTKN